MLPVFICKCLSEIHKTKNQPDIFYIIQYKIILLLLNKCRYVLKLCANRVK